MPTQQPTATPQAPKNRAEQPLEKQGLLFRVSEMYFFSPDPLPIFLCKYSRQPYARYCPSIETIEPMKGTGPWNYKITVVGDCSETELAQQVQDLAEYYAAAETELETA